MFCSKCGDPVEQNETYCNKCGNYVGFNNQNVKSGNEDNKKMVFIGVGIGVAFLVVVSIVLISFNKIGGYFFSDNPNVNIDEITEENSNNQKPQRKSKYSTIIITDNVYSGVEVSNDKDAYKLISKDSVDQKVNCPNEIKAIEDEIIKKYNVAAVNLCEMDVNFAKEVGNVFKKVYDEYPSVRGYLTNLTLVNASLSDSYIAAFMPVFNFATSDTSSTYPWVIKTQVLLNTSYFLNTSKLEAAVQDSSNSGHFPPNSTVFSPVAHELGHYLSFLAMMKNYDLESILLVDDVNVNVFYDVYADFGKGDFSLLMIEEAYAKCKKETNTTLAIDDWRATISNYAVAKDNSGNYIYDETIAEAFSDVYSNGDSAKEASKYVVSVLKSKLEGEV